MSNTVYTLANGGVSEIQWYQSINYFVQDIVFFLPLLNYPKMVSSIRSTRTPYLLADYHKYQSLYQEIHTLVLEVLCLFTKAIDKFIIICDKSYNILFKLLKFIKTRTLL